MVQNQLLGDTLRDVNLTLQTVDAGVGRICLCHDSTDAASDHGSVQQAGINGFARDLALAGRICRCTLGLSVAHGIISFASCIDCRLKEHIIRICAGFALLMHMILIVNLHIVLFVVLILINK